MGPELSAAVEVVCEAGRRLVPHFGNVTARGHKSDSPASVVTQLDIDTEHFIEDGLKKYFPDIGFHGEENGDKRGEERFWLVDPIDGTGHFVRGIPFSTTMLALIEGGHPIAAVIYNFVTDEMFTAEKGKGAFLNERPIHVSTRTLKESYLSIEVNVHEQKNLEKFLMLRSSGCFVHTTSAGFEYALVASGKIEGRITLYGYGSDWDYAPGALLVSEAGGVVTNVGSPSYRYTDHTHLAVNKEVYRELTESKDAIFPIYV